MDKQDYKKLTRFCKKVGVKQVIAYSCAGIDWKIEDKEFAKDMIMTLYKCAKIIGDRAGLEVKKAD